MGLSTTGGMQNVETNLPPVQLLEYLTTSGYSSRMEKSAGNDS